MTLTKSDIKALEEAAKQFDQRAKDISQNFCIDGRWIKAFISMRSKHMKTVDLATRLRAIAEKGKK